MKTTAEVRWFQSGTIPPGVQSWFEGGGSPPVRQAPRVDRYLRLADSEGLGIKLREGLLEIKQRTRTCGLAQFHPGAAGQVEAWRKWSFPLAGGGLTVDGLGIQPPAWIAVSKQRDLQIYSVGPGEQVSALLPGAWPGQGCALELCAVRAGGSAWWTLGFEAFGPEAGLESLLRQVVALTFGSGKAPWLAAEDSYGYAAWLSRHQVASLPPSGGD